MPTYHITWEIDLDAESPRDAAEQALVIQRNCASTATVFDVIEQDGAEMTRIDLDDPEEDADQDGAVAPGAVLGD